MDIQTVYTYPSLSPYSSVMTSRRSTGNFQAVGIGESPGPQLLWEERKIALARTLRRQPQADQWVLTLVR